MVAASNPESFQHSKKFDAENGISPQSQLQNRGNSSKKGGKLKFWVNVAAGTIVMMGVLASLGIFVVAPQVSMTEKQTILEDFMSEEWTRYKWPAPSYSLMSRFRRAAVTCDHGLCSEIGRDMLIRGGNAVDAMIASLFCLGVTNPQSSGIGGGFIATMYNRTTRSCRVIDARETAPMNTSRDMYGNDEWASKYGYRAIATPGELAGYWLAFKEFGSGRLTWRQLVWPSVELAKSGVPVSEYLAYVLAIKEKHFRTLPSMKDWVDNRTDRVYQFGDIIRRHKLAHTLEKIALSDDPVHLFYYGEMADIIVREIQENGGVMTKEDLMAYRPKVYDTPLIADLPLGGFENPINETNDSEVLKMCGPPPPSSFVVTQAIVNVMVARFSDHEREGNNFTRKTVLDDTAFYHWLIEAQKFAYARRTNLGDVDFVASALKLARNMTTLEHVRDILERIPKRAQPPEYYTESVMEQKEDHGTSHVSVVDSDGNGVSATSTVNRWFGAVVQSEELGIVWNDEMDDFSSPGMSNGFGFAPAEANFIEPGKRPMSSMSPMVIFNELTGKLKFVIGASGGSKIISALAKPIIRVLCFNETIKEAIDAPTLHNQFTPLVTQFEDTVPKELLNDLEEKFNQKFKPTTGFEGVVQGIHLADDGFIYANGDYRRRSNMHPEGY